jgi:CPA1 family monovalent cation:H+ antiporter
MLQADSAAVAISPHASATLILLVSVATAVAIGARWLRLPYTVALVIVGLGLGATHVVHAPHLTRDLVFTVFLPGLVFQAAYHLRMSALRRDAGAIVMLALPGVALGLGLTAVLTVLGTHVMDGKAIAWMAALGFGALITATDPISVVALVRSLGAPARLAVLIEAESLLNDGTAIVFFTMILAVFAGRTLGVGALILLFLRVVATGIAAGAAVGLLTGRIVHRIDDPMIEITLTAIAAYGSFALAEELGGSGVIATVVAGLVTGNHVARVGMSATSRAAVESFWEYIAFLLNSIVFLLLGLQVPLASLAEQWRLIVLAEVAVLLARGVVVSSVYGVLTPSRAPFPASWIGPLTWGGLRGALSMVLALSLPDAFPARSTLIAMTFGVVLLSIVVQGLTMAPLLRRFGVCEPSR